MIKITENESKIKGQSITKPNNHNLPPNPLFLERGPGAQSP